MSFLNFAQTRLTEEKKCVGKKNVNEECYQHFIRPERTSIAKNGEKVEQKIACLNGCRAE